MCIEVIKSMFLCEEIGNNIVHPLITRYTNPEVRVLSVVMGVIAIATALFASLPAAKSFYALSVGAALITGGVTGFLGVSALALIFSFGVFFGATAGKSMVAAVKVIK